MSTTLDIPLKNRWIEFHKENPKVRIRDASKHLGVTEAEIVASFSGSSVVRLDGNFRELIKRMPELGYVMCLTRNESCVHERKGVFEDVNVSSPHVGTVVGKDIDLRMFFSKWAYGFALHDFEEAGFKKSIQIFDKQGTAIIKIYSQQSTNHEAYDNLVRDFSASQQLTTIELSAADAPPIYEDESVDIESLRKDWSELKDTHDFFPMLKKHKVSRLRALEVAGEFAKKIANDTVVGLLNHASANNIEIMIFVANHGNIQIHTGPVNKIAPIPGWINVMDPDFNLHLKLDHIASTWAVKKPTVDGFVHSIEIFDSSGDMIVQFFGKRKPGKGELGEWKEFVGELF